MSHFHYLPVLFLILSTFCPANEARVHTEKEPYQFDIAPYKISVTRCDMEEAHRFIPEKKGTEIHLMYTPKGKFRLSYLPFNIKPTALSVIDSTGKDLGPVTLKDHGKNLFRLQMEKLPSANATSLTVTAKLPVAIHTTAITPAPVLIELTDKEQKREIAGDTYYFKAKTDNNNNKHDLENLLFNNEATGDDLAVHLTYFLFHGGLDDGEITLTGPNDEAIKYKILGGMSASGGGSTTVTKTLVLPKGTKKIKFTHTKWDDKKIVLIPVSQTIPLRKHTPPAVAAALSDIVNVSQSGMGWVLPESSPSEDSRSFLSLKYVMNNSYSFTSSNGKSDMPCKSLHIHDLDGKYLGSPLTSKQIDRSNPAIQYVTYTLPKGIPAQFRLTGKFPLNVYTARTVSNKYTLSLQTSQKMNVDGMSVDIIAGSKLIHYDTETSCTSITIKSPAGKRVDGIQLMDIQGQPVTFFADPPIHRDEGTYQDFYVMHPPSGTLQLILTYSHTPKTIYTAIDSIYSLIPERDNEEKTEIVPSVDIFPTALKLVSNDPGLHTDSPYYNSPYNSPGIFLSFTCRSPENSVIISGEDELHIYVNNKDMSFIPGRLKQMPKLFDSLGNNMGFVSPGGNTVKQKEENELANAATQYHCHTTQFPAPGSTSLNLIGSLPVDICTDKTTSRSVPLEWKCGASVPLDAIAGYVIKTEEKKIHLRFFSPYSWNVLNFSFTDAKGKILDPKQYLINHSFSRNMKIPGGYRVFDVSYEFDTQVDDLFLSVTYFKSRKKITLPLNLEFPLSPAY